MADDLVERLKEQANRAADWWRGDDAATCTEAAARIEALEAALAEALRERTEARAEAANLRADLKQAEGRVKAQPISTAPRDGTFVLLFGGETDEDEYGAQKHLDRSRPVVGMWTEDVCADTLGCRADDDEEVDWWAVCYWDSDWRTGYINPTHWLPIRALASDALLDRQGKEGVIRGTKFNKMLRAEAYIDAAMMLIPDDLVERRLEMLFRDLKPYADKPIGSLRIGMDEVRAILALEARIEALEAALAEARRQALEEAAKVAEEYPTLDYQTGLAMKGAAQAIRNMKTAPDAGEGKITNIRLQSDGQIFVTRDSSSPPPVV